MRIGAMRDEGWRLTTWWVPLLAGLTLVAVGCGGSDDPPAAVAEPAASISSSETTPAGPDAESDDSGDAIDADGQGDDNGSSSGGLGETSNPSETFSAGAPTFCYQLEEFETMDSDASTGPETLGFIVNFFQSIANESDVPTTAESAEEMLEPLQPVVDALEKAGGDEDKILDHLSREDEVAFRNALEEMQAGMMVTMIMAAGECSPFVNEESGEAAGQPSTGDTTGAAGSGDADTGSAQAERTESGSVDPAALKSAVSIEQVTTHNSVSTNVSNPNQGSAVMTIDRVFTTPTYRDLVAESGRVLLVVEFQLFNDDGLLNVFDSAFRVIADGSTEGPMNSLITVLMGAGVINDALIFSFPANATSLTLEAGPPPVAGAGLTAVYDITLQADPAALDHIAAQEAVSDEAIEASGAVESTPDDGLIDINPVNAAQGEGVIEIVNVSTTQRYDGQGSGRWEKFLVVDWRLTVTTGLLSNLFVEFMRIEADDETYMAIEGPITIAQSGDVIEETSVFKIPRNVDEVTIHAGPPEARADGLRARFEASLG